LSHKLEVGERRSLASHYCTSKAFNISYTKLTRIHGISGAYQTVHAPERRSIHRGIGK